MSFWGIVIFSILLLVAFIAAIADVRADTGPQEMTRMDHVLWRVFGFFGIGNVPPMLALAVFASTAAIAGAAIDAIARMHLGDAYPAWMPADAFATGAGLGLLCARLLAVGAEPNPE